MARRYAYAEPKSVLVQRERVDTFWQREPQEIAALGARDPRSSRKVLIDKSQACSLLAAERMPQDAQVTIETLVLEVLL